RPHVRAPQLSAPCARPPELGLHRRSRRTLSGLPGLHGRLLSGLWSRQLGRNRGPAVAPRTRRLRRRILAMVASVRRWNGGGAGRGDGSLRAEPALLREPCPVRDPFGFLASDLAVTAHRGRAARLSLARRRRRAVPGRPRADTSGL